MVASNKKKDPIPVTLLSGFLGAGKTSLLKHILESSEHKLKIACIVNDMAEINVDASLIQQTCVIETKQEVISLQNGCICCTLRSDLIREINRIRQLGTFNYVVIESTGIAEPQQVAESFCADPETSQLAQDETKMLWNVARLDTCVTVIDALHFPRHLSSLKRFKDEFTDGLENEADEEGDKNIASLLVQQVGFANVIILNKIDLVAAQGQATTLKLIQSLNPTATIVTSKFGVVDLKLILNTHQFNMEEAEASSGWLDSFVSNTTASEADEYGVVSFVYRARKPFHPNRLARWMQSIFHFAHQWEKRKFGYDEKRTETMMQHYGQILRSKGLCWIAGRDDLMGGWAHSGHLITLNPMTPWYASIPETEWEVEEKDIKDIKCKFGGIHGDRRQEIVFIGVDLKTDAIVESLDKCLLTDEEIQSHSCEFREGQYYDPLPPWVVTHDAPGVMAATLRHGHVHKFLIAPGLRLALSNLALNNESDSAEVAVKVWLYFEKEDRRRVLLATLRSGASEQYPILLSIAADDSDDGPFTLSAELQSSGTKRHRNVVDEALAEQVEVHVAGNVLVVKDKGDEEGDDEVDDDDEHVKCKP